MLRQYNFKINDKVKFNINGNELKGVITAIHTNNKIVRVRVIKHGRRCWHEWLRIKDIEINNEEEMDNE